MARLGSARGSTPSSRGKGGGRAALHGGTGRQRRRLPRRDGAASQQELPGPAARDSGRRGTAGYVFGAWRLAPGAWRPATGEALTLTFERRTTANGVDFLGAVERWIDPAVERVHAVLDNLNIHSAPDVLLFGLLHPR